MENILKRSSKDFLTTLLLLTGASFSGLILDASAESNSQSEDETPPAVQRLVPAGWKLESYALGHLISKTSRDLAMSIAREPEQAFGNAAERKLLVATATNSGYKIVASGDRALTLGMGPAGGDPSLSISKGEIVTEIFGGSAYKFTENFHFALIRGKWLLTRFRLNGYQSLTEDHASEKIDVNVLTGHVSGEMSREHHKTQKTDFNEVFSLRTADINKIPSDAPKLRIADTTGKHTAQIRSAHNDREITFEVSVVGNESGKNNRVFLTTGNGVPLHPKRSKRSASTSGFTQTLIFNLPDGKQFNDPNEDGNQFLNWIVNVELLDQTNLDSRTHFNSASPGKRAHIRGGVLAITEGSIPSLKNINVQNGSFQEPPIPAPSF